MKIYIAGKITGDALYKAKFQAEQDRLERAGNTVLNPAKLPAGLENSCYIKLCLTMIDEADAVQMLPDWQESGGAKIEKLYAEYCGKQVICTSSTACGGPPSPEGKVMGEGYGEISNIGPASGSLREPPSPEREGYVKIQFDRAAEQKSRRRLDSLFGPEWRSEIPEGTGENGFLLLECPICGMVHTRNLKTKRQSVTCQTPFCGAEIPLEDLKIAYFHCSGCGREWKYKTNLTGEKIQHKCLNCGKTMKSRMGYKGTAYKPEEMFE